MLTAAFPPTRFASAPAAGQRRAIGLNVVVFFFFALTALVFLTRAAVAANAINRDVASAIEPATVGINERTGHLPVLDTTVTLTTKISKATGPLADRLDGVVTTTSRIDAHLGVAQSDISDIGRSVGGIEGSTGRVRPGLAILGDHVASVHSQVGDVAARYRTVAAASGSMVRNLTSTNASLAQVLADTRPLQGNVDSIRRTITEIDGRARSIEASPILLNGGLLNLTGLLQSLDLGNLLGGT